MPSIDDVEKQSIPLRGPVKVVSPPPLYCSIRTGFSSTFFLIHTLYTEMAKKLNKPNMPGSSGLTFLSLTILQNVCISV